MSMEAIGLISQAEEQARQMKVTAAAQAKQALQTAEADGKVALEGAAAQAEMDLKALTAQAHEQAAAAAQALAASTEKQKDVLRTRAEACLDQAAQLVVERIVGS